MDTRLTHLECAACARTCSWQSLRNLCECGKPLLARYDLSAPFKPVDRPGLWRYFPMLPVFDLENIRTLGEGWTPLIPIFGIRRLWWIKEEGLNPTGSFKARGMAVAISMARQLGAKRVCVPTAGNAGGACAAYAAAAGLEAHVYAPEDAPSANLKEITSAGARLTLVPGTIADAARRMREDMARQEMFDVSTLKEPYRVEGKKTMGYELFEQLGGRLPDVIVYPAGGGTGLIGMWKAFEEMERLGWIGRERPRMIAVQAEGCAPLVEAFREGAAESRAPKDPRTIAAGLRVPKAFADWLILRILRESGGTAVAASDDEIRAAMSRLHRETGILACPEGAACLPAALRLEAEGGIREGERVILFNTGSGLKYLDLL